MLLGEIGENPEKQHQPPSPDTIYQLTKGVLMKAEFTDEERKKVFRGIKKKYSKVAKKPEGLFKYPTGRAGLEGLGYNDS